MGGSIPTENTLHSPSNFWSYAPVDVDDKISKKRLRNKQEVNPNSFLLL